MRGATESPLSHPLITQRAPTKGKCYSHESKKGTGSGTYRVKQIGTKCAGNEAGVPPYGMYCNTNRVPTLSGTRR
jgi:hypothetical protein